MYDEKGRGSYMDKGTDVGVRVGVSADADATEKSCNMSEKVL